MSLADRLSETELHLADVGRLADDPTLSPEVRTALRQALDELSAKQAGRKLEIVAFGTVSSGKSSLLNALAGRDVFRTDAVGGTTVRRSELRWPGADHVVLVDTPGLAEVKGTIARSRPARPPAMPTSCCWSSTAPSKDFEHKLLGDLVGMEKRVIVCLNKSDWFTDADRRRLVEQLSEQADGIVPAADVVAVRANPVVRTRVRVAADGREIEESVQEESDISVAGRADSRDRFPATEPICWRRTCCCEPGAWRPTPARGSARPWIGRPKRLSSGRCGKRPPPRR